MMMARAQAVDDAQCTADPDITPLGWRKNATHATSACNMQVLHVGIGGLSPSALVQRLSTATAPLLIRGLLNLPGWGAMAATLGNRSSLVRAFGAESVRLSVGQLLAHGPESTRLDGKKLAFMRDAWDSSSHDHGNGSDAGNGTSTSNGNGTSTGTGNVRDTVRRQVLAGEARPRLRLAEWVRALREGTAPRDAYVFHNVSAGPVARALAPLHALWRNVSLALPAAKPPAAPPTAPPALPPLTRLGVGGSEYEPLVSSVHTQRTRTRAPSAAVASATTSAWPANRSCSLGWRSAEHQFGGSVMIPSLFSSRDSTCP